MTLFFGFDYAYKAPYTVHSLLLIKSLFTKLPWPGDSEGTFRSSSQAATSIPHTVKASHYPFLLLREGGEKL